jgi:hypothetical protein
MIGSISSPRMEKERVRELYSRMQLLGIAEFETYRQRADGTFAWINVLLIAVYDHKMRFVGHRSPGARFDAQARLPEGCLKELEAVSLAR